MTPERAQLIEWASTVEGTPYKTHCATMVAKFLGIETRFLHTLEDLIRAARRNKKYVVRSFIKNLPITIVGEENVRCLKNVRRFVRATSDPYAQNVWLIRWVDEKNLGHVLLVDTYGETLVDTSPREEQNAVTDLYCLRKRGAL